MTAFDGPTLRAVRESLGIPLRRIARHAGMSHGHLSKVERGEYGRPVTPAILAAYERITGVKLAEAVAAATEQGELPATGRRPRVWRPGQMTEIRRRSYNAIIAALSIGGHLGEPFGRLLDAAGRPMTPAPPGDTDVVQLEQVAELITSLDLSFGGGLVSQLSKAILRWAVPMLDAQDLDDAASRRLHGAVATLAHRAAWAAFDVAAHEAARGLFRLTLFTAVRAGDANLRAHTLADVAAQHCFLDYHSDALEMIRFAEGDERVAPAVRMVLLGVKARIYAELGEAEACRRAIGLAERAAADADSGAPGWLAGLAAPAHLQAATGHAMAALADTTGADSDRGEAERRLTQAIDAYDPDTHTRAHGLCVARLARVYAAADDIGHAAHWGRMAAAVATGIRSVRLDRHLNELRAAVAAHHTSPMARELIDTIDAAVAAGE
jgi:transcriptional regulator with XRE-family HTH domain